MKSLTKVWSRYAAEPVMLDLTRNPEVNGEAYNKPKPTDGIPLP